MRPSSLAALLLALVAAPHANGQEFTPMRFSDRLNWTDRQPQLVRMILDPQVEGRVYRRVAHPFKDRQLLERPIVNVIILIHGHNEQEKAGFSPTTAPDPWWFHYKRDVWSLFYKTFREESAELEECTAFYEFIYPTYWPIFTPVEGHSEHLLGRCLARALLDGAVNDDRRLAQWLSPKSATQVNLFLVAHSMGGLVSRSGLRQVKEVWPHFRQLVTWGTPHHGSPLVTLGYAFRRYTPQSRYGFIRLEDSEQFQQFLAQRLQIDTPGTRDTRWDNGFDGRPRLLPLEQFFMHTPETLPHPDEFHLQTGSWLINRNLRTFNRNDPFYGGDRYTFLYGVTTKRLSVRDRSLVATGAWVLPYLLTGNAGPAPNPANPVDTDSDGAVPIFSSSGVGLAGIGRAINLGDVDHEEYFGAPGDGFPAPEDETAAQRTARERGEATSRRTLQVLGLTMERCRCPSINVTEPVGATLPAAGKTVQVRAKLIWPPELAKEPGRAVRSADAFLRVTFSEKHGTLGPMKVQPNGDLAGEFPMPDLGNDEKQVVVRVTFTDGSILEGEQVISRPTSYKFRHLRQTSRTGEFKSPEGQRVGLPFLKRFLEAPKECRLRIPNVSGPAEKREITLQRHDVPPDTLFWFLGRDGEPPTDVRGNFIKDEGRSLAGRFLGETIKVDDLGGKSFATTTWTIRARMVGDRLLGTISYYDWYYSVSGQGAAKKVTQHRGTITLEFDAEPVD